MTDFYRALRRAVAALPATPERTRLESEVADAQFVPWTRDFLEGLYASYQKTAE